jgi:hypothetical protein
MSYLVAAPEFLASAATDLAGIGFVDTHRTKCRIPGGGVRSRPIVLWSRFPQPAADCATAGHTQRAGDRPFGHTRFGGVDGGCPGQLGLRSEGLARGQQFQTDQVKPQLHTVQAKPLDLKIVGRHVAQATNQFQFSSFAESVAALRHCLAAKPVASQGGIQ